MSPKHHARSSSTKHGTNGQSDIENNQLPDASVTAWGVKRPSYGTLGEPIAVISNVRRASISQTIIHQYDVVISPQHNGISQSPRHQGFWPTRHDKYNIMQRLQEVIAPEIFTPQGVYDGGKNFYTSHELDFGDSDSHEFEVQLQEEYQDASLLDPNSDAIRAPGLRAVNVRLTMVAEIDTGVLGEFLSGKHSHDGEVCEALTVFNVIIQAVPSIRLNHPYKRRPFKFLIDDGIKDVGNGVVAWRAYIQSARPGIGHMLINTDMSMGFMHKPGRLIDICLEFLGISENDPHELAHLEDHKHTSLEEFLKGLQVLVHVPGVHRPPNIRPRPYTIKELSKLSASEIRSQTRRGATQGPTVAHIFQQTYNQPLVLPQLPCITIKRHPTATQIPLELCDVIPGQIMRSWVSPESRSMSHSFSFKNPWERLEHICEGVAVLERGQSSYVEQFGIKIESQITPLNARVLDQVPLKFGRSFDETMKVSNGSWNMTDKRVYQPATIREWAVTIFEIESRFGRNQARNLIQNLFISFRRLGINISNANPPVHWCNGQGSISDQIRNCVRIKPDLLIVVLPPGGGEIYKAVKHLGDVQAGVATQCLQNRQHSSRVSMLELEPSSSYYTNICLKINAKLGGINTVPESSYTGMNILTDPEKPTIIMGAHVLHPASDIHGQPSFASIVGNIDSNTAKYVADTRLQTPKSEIIEDLRFMTVHILSMWKKHHELIQKNLKPESNSTNMPKRIILYRSGVSDSLHQIVLSHELPYLKGACRELGINAKISIVVVSKPHRIRFFPDNKDYHYKNWSVNLPSGTVIDRKVVHPVEFDFYLLSHCCKYGTSHPTHYNVIHDENDLTPNDLQSLTYALTHICARSTNSLSVPAPVHYARLANSQAKNRYKPNFEQELFQEVLQDETNIRTKSWAISEKFKQEFKPLHPERGQQMYFC